jgi:hypothetical protein
MCSTACPDVAPFCVCLNEANKTASEQGLEQTEKYR